MRLAVGAVLFLYLLPEALSGGPDAGIGATSLCCQCWASWCSPAAIFASIVVSPGASPVRRVLGAVVDSAATSYFMVRTGVNGLPLYVVYLWIIVGNGFRYGKAYLVNTLVLSGSGSRSCCTPARSGRRTSASAGPCCSRWSRSRCTC